MVAAVNLSIQLDRNSAEPIYRQLIRTIRMQIESGHLTAGTRLPASRDLARQLGISRISVVNAYAELRAEGYLDAHAGRGTFVASEATHSAQRSSYTRDDGDYLDYSMRDMMRLARRPDVINFSHGSPPREFFPMQALREALNYVLDRDGAAAMTYEMPEGYPPLRAAVRDFVSALGIRCSPDNVLITGGAQQAIDLAVQALLGQGDTLLAASPTYLGIIDIAHTRRVQINTVRTDEDGIRIDCLEQAIIDHRPRAIYVMPSFQNPTGQVMPLHRRRQLLNLANEYRIPVIEDAVYHEFRFEGESLPPLAALDETGNVLHIAGFTKMLLPGMRIGYLIADTLYLERLVRVKQSADISTSGLNQRAIHYLLGRGILATQLERNNAELRRRRDAALEAAARYFPKGTTWRYPQGGLYLWVTLPKDGPTAAELFISAVQRGVAFAVGNVFFTEGGGSYNMRLNYGLQPPEIIEEGFKRLGQAWQTLASDYQNVQSSPLL